LLQFCYILVLAGGCKLWTDSIKENREKGNQQVRVQLNQRNMQLKKFLHEKFKKSVMFESIQSSEEHDEQSSIHSRLDESLNSEEEFLREHYQYK